MKPFTYTFNRDILHQQKTIIILNYNKSFKYNKIINIVKIKKILVFSILPSKLCFRHNKNQLLNGVITISSILNRLLITLN